MNAHPYMFLALFVAAAAVFSATPLLLAWLWGKFSSRPGAGAIKRATYECGLKSSGDAWIQFQPEYYLYAILFLVFDVESVFLLPMAAAFTGLSAGAIFAMLLFILLLAEGLVWAWAKGILNWR